MTYTKEQEKDIENRIGAFAKEYKELVEKYQVDFLAFPQYIPAQDGSFQTVLTSTIMDKKYADIKSPFNIIKEK